MVQSGSDRRREIRDQRRDFLVERTRVALWVLLAGTGVFALADAALAPRDLLPLWSVKLSAMGLFALALREFRVGRVRRWSAPLALLSTALGYLVAASSGLITGQLEVSMMLCAVIALGLAAAMPWGVRAQLLHITLGTAAILVVAVGVPQGAGVVAGYAGVAVAILFASSLYLAYEAQRQTQHQAAAFVSLRNQDNRLRLLVQQMPAALWSTDRDLRVTSVVGAGLRAVQIEPREGRMPTLEEYLGTADPGFPPVAAHRAALRGESRSYEMTWQGRTFDAHVEPFRAADGSITGTLGVALDQTDLKEAQQQSATLLEIAREISGTLDRQQILDRVAHRAVRSLTCDALIVFYWDEDRRRYRVIAQHGLPAEWAGDRTALEIEEDAPIVQHLRDHHSAVLDEATAQDLLPPKLLERFHVVALAATPLQVRNRGVGALLALRFSGNRAFTAGQRELLVGIARHVAIAVEVADLHASVKREGEVSAALARVGRELIASMDPPELMQRLSRITTEVLGCSASYTVLHDAREGAYVPAAAYGITDEQWEQSRLVRLPNESLASLIERLEAGEVVHFQPTEATSKQPLGRLADQYRLSAALCVALRRGQRLIGYQVAHLQRPGVGFGQQQIDILRGIGGLASLALENAYLVQELGRANSIKSDFVATMSHELRTPLNAIIGYNLLMREGEFGDLTPEQVKVCEHIDRSSRTLLDLISATLDVSRLDAGAIALNLGELSPAALVETLRNEIGPPRSPRVRLEWEVAEGVPDLYTDRMKVKVILKNLVENALKFTDEGSVRVLLRPRDDGVEFRVNDTGVGIPLDAQSEIFEAFRQLDGSSTRRHGGVGLGLYIVRRLVDMLGGSVGLSSTPGKGSTFEVWLPARYGQAVPNRAQVA